MPVASATRPRRLHPPWSSSSPVLFARWLPIPRLRHHLRRSRQSPLRPRHRRAPFHRALNAGSSAATNAPFFSSPPAPILSARPLPSAPAELARAPRPLDLPLSSSPLPIKGSTGSPSSSSFHSHSPLPLSPPQSAEFRAPRSFGRNLAAAISAAVEAPQPPPPPPPASHGCGLPRALTHSTRSPPEHRRHHRAAASAAFRRRRRPSLHQPPPFWCARSSPRAPLRVAATQRARPGAKRRRAAQPDAAGIPLPTWPPPPRPPQRHLSSFADEAPAWLPAWQPHCSRAPGPPRTRVFPWTQSTCRGSHLSAAQYISN